MEPDSRDHSGLIRRGKDLGSMLLCSIGMALFYPTCDGKPMGRFAPGSDNI